MSGRPRWPPIPLSDEDVRTFVRFRALVRRLSAEPGSECGLCDRTFFPGQSVTLLYCGHIMHRDCVIHADYVQLIERRQERRDCPRCNNRILTRYILQIPPTPPTPPTPPGPPPSAPSGSDAAPAA